MKITQVSPDLRVSFETSGTGPPLVFLHAFPLGAAMWKAQLAEFSDSFEVVAPNFRGLGTSSAFSDKPSLQTLADDLAVWLEALGIYEAITLCGLSMGGYVALEFARLFPEKLGALILADTRADADNSDVKKARNELIGFAKTSNGRAIVQRMLPRLLGETTRTQNLRLAPQVKGLAAANSGENLAQLVAAMRDRRDSTSILSAIRVPTLVIGGAEDVISPPDVMAQMAAQIPGARHVVIAGAGHLSNLEQPEVFNRELRVFLTSLRRIAD